MSLEFYSRKELQSFCKANRDKLALTPNEARIAYPASGTRERLLAVCIALQESLPKSTEHLPFSIRSVSWGPGTKRGDVEEWGSESDVERRVIQRMPYCYQQKESDCSHWAFRIASEYLCSRKMTRNEESTFYDWPCASDGSQSHRNIAVFAHLFPELCKNIIFTLRSDFSRRSTRRNPFLINTNPQSHCVAFTTCLQEGGVIICDIEHFDFPKNNTRLIKPSNARQMMHTVCIMAETKTTYIVADANVNTPTSSTTQSSGRTWKSADCIKHFLKRDITFKTERGKITIASYILVENKP